MNVDQKVIDRLQELIEQASKVQATRTSRSGGGITYLGDDAVNYEMSHQWGVSALNILSRVFGKDSDHYKRFNELFPKLHDYHPILKGLGILKAAKDDYEKGYLFETRNLIQAELFDDFLEQAEYLLQSGYYAPAAVVAGAVLEDGLRQLCIRNGVAVSAKPKLDMMNADLTKAQVYTVLVQKKITALADLRNKAAHGKWTEFTEQDVREMLPQVRSFMEAHFS
jgi:hypothetical protein